MQSLEVISINLWQILISLANLAILYCLLKKFLYKPVKKTIASRQEAIDQQYRAAEEAEKSAMASRDLYAEKLAGANAEADSLIHEATANANRRSERIVADARDKAEAIVRQGQIEAAMEKKKAQATIRREITDVSAALTEKLLGREMNTGDHRELIDSFLQEMGDEQ
ncbi:MAG: F0F1 ATP synthase subunit B [Aristaeellaceae bacterium]